MDINEVGRLIRGSHNIDRMRREIEETVRMILGYATRVSRTIDEKGIAEDFKTPTCRWVVSGITGCMGKVGQLTARCWHRMGNTNGSFLAYSSIPKEIPLYTENVQSVYLSLPCFVEGMLKTLPELKEKFQTLIESSEVVFSS